MKEDLTAEFITWVKENISPDEIPWLKLKTSTRHILYHVEHRGRTIMLREKYDMMNKLFTPAVPMSNERKSVAFSIVDESLEAVPRQRTGYEYGITNDEARKEDASALFEMALCYRGFDYINTR
ncbi:eukaryotic translation initiation factor 3 subunit A [Pestalotiopsis sp. IQ-011]